MKRCLKLWLCLLGFTILMPISDAEAFEFTTHGYYRLRFENLHDLDTQTNNSQISQGTNGDNDRFGTIAFGQQRFRLDPILKLNDNISFQAQFDILDNVLFGQDRLQQIGIVNPITGTVSLPGGNGAFGVIGNSAGDPTSGVANDIVVRRLWVDLFTPIGKFRLGRQPIHWGLGILQNDGNSMNGDYGDTGDSVVYLAAHQLKNGSVLNGGLIYNFAFENTVDPSIDGLESGIGSNDSDTHQAISFLVYQNDDFELGAFGGIRFRNGTDGATTTTAIALEDDGTGHMAGVERPAGIDGDTRLFVADLYGKGTFGRYTLGAEAVYIAGKVTTGVAIDAVELTIDEEDNGATNPITQPIEMQPESDVSVFMAALEFEGKYDFGGEFKLMAGYAQGDSQPLSSKITQFGFRRDYDVALLMFEEPLGTSPAIQIAQSGRTVLGHRPVSGNYVNNAAYFTLGYKHAFDVSSWLPRTKDFKVGLKGITAWAPSNNLDIDLAAITGTTGLPRYLNTSRWYGFEVDASVEATFFEYLKWRGDVGFLLPGGLYDIKTEDLDFFNSSGISGIDFDGADPAFALKTTLFFEF